MSPGAPDPRELLLSARRERVEQVVAGRTRALAVVLEDLEDPHNVAAVLRTCEGFGVQEVHAITRRFAFHPNPKISQGAEKWLDVRLHREPGRCLGELRERGFVLCATDLGPGAGSLLELPLDRPLALVFGTEKSGVSAQALERCDLRFKIPMLGFAQSLNISVAAAICISHVVLRRLERPPAHLRLAEADRQALRDRFYALSVKQRHRLFARSERVNEDGGSASKASEESR